MDESLSFDECDKRGHNLWLVPTGNGSALSRLCPQSDVEADIGYTLTRRSVSEASAGMKLHKKVVGRKQAVGGFLVT